MIIICICQVYESQILVVDSTLQGGAIVYRVFLFSKTVEYLEIIDTWIIDNNYKCSLNIVYWMTMSVIVCIQNARLNHR